jgi:steroid Delta-isomerase
LSGFDVADRARGYARFFETLTRDTVDDLDALCAPDIRFVDPFNDLRGLAAYRRVYAHMFAVLDQPVFVIENMAISGRTAYFKWTFSARTKGRRSLSIHLVGMTEAHYGPSGLVIEHIDHWDAAGQLYGRLPAIGWLFRWLGRRFRVPSES